MKKEVRNWLVGSGVVAAGAAAVAASTRAAGAYMVRMAMDRQEPQRLQKRRKKVSGGAVDLYPEEALEAAKRRLEAQATQKVCVYSHDGLRLVGHWYPAKKPKRILIAMHGWRSCWSRDFGLIAPFWHQNGCSVLFTEQRGQGESDGAYIGFGMLERYDCLKWANWVQEHNTEGLPIYLVGLSMGAASVLMSADLELPETVRGIMADCGFTSADSIWRHVAQNNLGLRYGLYAGTANQLCKKRIQVGAKEVLATEALKHTQIPVLLIHGTDDSFVPVSMTYENYKACAGPKKLLIVPGAEHALSYCTEPERYEQTTLEFWAQYDTPENKLQRA